MNFFLETLSNPIWQLLAVVIALSAPVLMIVVRTRDVHASAQQKRRDTNRVLLVSLVALLLMSAGVGLLHRSDPSSVRTSNRFLTPAPTPSPTPSPQPSPIPKPTPTPQLAHSITEVLTAFCDAINNGAYQAAWNEYTSSLQHAHPEPATAAAWERFTHCSIPDQGGDPAAWTVLTLTLGPGYTDRFGRSGDTDYKVTMGVQASAWRITQVCEIMAEGCYAVSWG